MSKNARLGQATITKNNSVEMAKMLFWGDNDQGRRDSISRLLSFKKKSSIPKMITASYSTSQLEYLLVLMLALTTAEKRTQEVYQNDFSKRCDAISQEHSLNEDQYWIDGSVPPEWIQLDAEFEQRSVQILIDTLREYSLFEIADDIHATGSNQFFEIIANIEVQFMRVMKQPALVKKEPGAEHGSIPETLRSASRSATG